MSQDKINNLSCEHLILYNNKKYIMSHPFHKIVFGLQLYKTSVGKVSI